MPKKPTRASRGFSPAPDDDVLHAALAFVDAFDSDSTASGESSSASDASKSSSSRRVRDELFSLRLQAEELQLQLAQLQRQQSASSGPMATGLAQRAIVSVWEAMATRQREQRKEAERENAELRALLDEQARAVKRMEKLFKSKCWQKVPFAGQSANSQARLLHLSELLSVHVSQMGASFHSIFNAPKFQMLASAPTASQDLVTRDDPLNGKVIELFDSRIVPFHFQRTGNAIWAHMAQQNIPGERIFTRDVEITESRIERDVSFGFTLPAKDKAVFHCKVLGRRFVHVDCEAIVWAVAVDVDDDFKQDDDGLPFTQRLWTVVRPFSQELDHSSDVTLAQTYLLSCPSADSLGSRRKSMALNDHLSCVRHHVHDYWVGVERLLLDKLWLESADARRTTIKNDSDLLMFNPH